jgi:hypothetical protein
MSSSGKTGRVNARRAASTLLPRQLNLEERTFAGARPALPSDLTVEDLGASQRSTSIAEHPAVVGSKAVLASVENITEAKHAVWINRPSSDHRGREFLPSINAGRRCSPGDQAVADDDGE